MDLMTEQQLDRVEAMRRSNLSGRNMKRVRNFVLICAWHVGAAAVWTANAMLTLHTHS